MLSVAPEVRDQMFAHGLAERPNEACGMFSVLAGLDIVDYFHPMRNVAESSSVFVLDAQEMLDLERNAEATGRELIGVMHSHVATSAYPSPTDVRDSSEYDPLGTYFQVIVSLRDAEPVLRCFQILGDQITELPVVITDGDDDLQDEGAAVAVSAVVRLRPAD